MTEQKIYKPLPSGNESFRELITNGRYYVDKTPYLKNVLTDGCSVNLFTRPRRFGKTLLLDMFDEFLSVNDKNPDDKSQTIDLFKNTAILKDKEFTDRFLGNFCVISISLKDVIADEYSVAYGQLGRTIFDVANAYSLLQDSDEIPDNKKQILKKLSDLSYITNPANKLALSTALLDISTCLYQHFKKQVVILIDEYDVPLSKASEYGFHEQMVNTMSSFLSVLKVTPDNEYGKQQTVYKVIMTGCLKVAKNSIFTGINNLDVNTVLDLNEDYSGMIGFKKQEVIKILDDYDMSDYADMVKENYDGYRFNDDEMFCPWDVIKFLKENHKHVVNNQLYKIQPNNYWINTTSASLLKGYLGFLTEQDTQKIQDLVDGKTIEVAINDSMNYDCLSMHKSEDFFSLMVHTGYLTSVGFTDRNIYKVKIPNKEVYECFEKNIVENFKESLNVQGSNKALELANAFISGDEDTAAKVIFDALQNYVSIRDFATKANKENFYHGFLSGIFSNCIKSISDYKSNAEAGNGYADIMFKDKNNSVAVIIELKACPKEKTLQMIDEAFKQIETKEYIKAFDNDIFVKEVLAYAITFSGKLLYLKKKKLK